MVLIKYEVSEHTETPWGNVSSNQNWSFSTAELWKYEKQQNENRQAKLWQPSLIKYEA